MTTKISKFLTALLLLGSASCNTFLEEENLSGLTADSYYATTEGIESLVNSCYTPMKFWYGKEAGIAMSETGTDILTFGSGMEAPEIARYDITFNARTASVDFEWQRLYTALNTCNTAVARIKLSPLPEETKKIREGEARFLRAFYLWHIVETWGPVHLTTEETKGMVLTANKSSVENFYKQIFEDLEYATNNLPLTSGEYGRATKPAAEAFAARMHLTRKNYGEASRLAQNVINGYGFSLLPKYGDLWDINNVRNAEVVWNVNFTADQILNNDYQGSGYPIREGGNNAHMFFIMVYDVVPGMERDIPNGRPFARFMPTAYLLDLFDESKDARYEATFQTVYYANQTDASKRPEGMNVGDTAIYISKKIIPKEEKAAKNYLTIDRSTTYNAQDLPVVRNRFMSFKKFLDPARPTVAAQHSRRDAFVIRLAEMYMIVAEAELLGGDPGLAVQHINAVRRRAALPGKELEMEVTATDLSLDFILDERAREFAGEQQRWFDLKRTGKLVERVQKYNPDAASNIQPFHTLRPIPQNQLDAVTNKNEFTQNEGYN
jgi:hypothetical protein